MKKAYLTIAFLLLSTTAFASNPSIGPMSPWEDIYNTGGVRVEAPAVKFPGPNGIGSADVNVLDVCLNDAGDTLYTKTPTVAYIGAGGSTGGHTDGAGGSAGGHSLWIPTDAAILSTPVSYTDYEYDRQHPTDPKVQEVVYPLEYKALPVIEYGSRGTKNLLFTKDYRVGGC